MTARTEHKPTQLESAIDNTITSISQNATHFYRQHHPAMPEPEFRQLLARVLENMTLNDWRRRLQLEPLPGEE